jgi:hypothetical protein
MPYVFDGLAMASKIVVPPAEPAELIDLRLRAYLLDQ